MAEWSLLPDEVWEHIFSFADISDLAKIQLCSTYFKLLTGRYWSGTTRHLRLVFSHPFIRSVTIDGYVQRTKNSTSEPQFASREADVLAAFTQRFGAHFETMELEILRVDDPRQLHRLVAIFAPCMPYLKSMVLKLDKFNHNAMRTLSAILVSVIRNSGNMPNIELHVTEPTLQMLRLLNLFKVNAIRISNVNYMHSEKPWQLLANRREHLTSLCLANIHDLESYHFREFTSLQCLSLYRTSGFPKELNSATKLSCLRLNGAQGIYMKEILPFLGAFTYLELSSASIKAEDLLPHLKYAVALRVFQFQRGGWDFRWTLSSLVKAIVEHCPNIEMIGMSLSPNEDLLCKLISEILEAKRGQCFREMPFSRQTLIDFELCLESKSLMEKLNSKLKEFDINISPKIEKYSGMNEANRVFIFDNCSESWITILNDLPSTRERVWHNLVTKYANFC